MECSLTHLIILCLSSVLFSQDLKIYISADMEGIAGVVSDAQLGPEGFEYNRFREFMTMETVTAVNAAFEAGATEVLVSDSHGNGQNLLIEKFPKAVRIIRSWPRPLGMMEGIDASYAGAIFIGYHSSTTNQDGVRAHTKSSSYLADIRLNGKSMSETGINAAIAGHFNVPVIMISGDDAIVKSARELLGNIETAEVKQAISFHSANTLTPEAANMLISQKVKAAIGRIKSFKPYKLANPIRLEVTFKNYRPSQILAYLPIVERIDAHSILYKTTDMIAVSKFLTFMSSYSISVKP